MKTSASIKISRDLRDVFEFTTEKLAEWSTVVVSDETLVEKPGRVGTTFRIITRDRGTQMEFAGVVTAHEPPFQHSVAMTGKQFEMEVDYLFKKIEGGTELTQISVVKPKGWIKILFFLFGWMLKKSGCLAAQKELENLKRLLEDGM